MSTHHYLFLQGVHVRPREQCTRAWVVIWSAFVCTNDAVDEGGTEGHSMEM